MIRVFSNDWKPRQALAPNIQVFYNHPFPIQEIIDIFHSLFGNDYRYEDLVQMIRSANHIFCSYDYTSRRCIACALVNNAGGKGVLYINLFGVRQSNQHHGVGTQLLKAVIRWARRNGYSFVYLHVNADNYKAIGLYEKVGFYKHEYLPNYYKNASKKNPAGFRMILTLP